MDDHRRTETGGTRHGRRRNCSVRQDAKPARRCAGNSAADRSFHLCLPYPRWSARRRAVQTCSTRPVCLCHFAVRRRRLRAGSVQHRQCCWDRYYSPPNVRCAAQWPVSWLRAPRCPNLRVPEHCDHFRPDDCQKSAIRHGLTGFRSGPACHSQPDRCPHPLQSCLRLPVACGIRHFSRHRAPAPRDHRSSHSWLRESRHSVRVFPPPVAHAGADHGTRAAPPEADDA